MASTPKKRGIFRDSGKTDKVADFSYENDALAQLIVDMWNGAHGDLLAAPSETDYGQRSTNAKAVFAARGIYFEEPIVITEDEYDDGFTLEDAGLGTDEGIVFVVPRQTRVTTAGATPLLETAKMLMAITPNGI